MIEDANQLRVTMQQMRRLLLGTSRSQRAAAVPGPGYSPPWPKHLWKTWIAYARRSRVFLINLSL